VAVLTAASELCEQQLVVAEADPDRRRCDPVFTGRGGDRGKPCRIDLTDVGVAI